MRPAALAFLALAMSTDAFAAALGKGAGAGARPKLSNALRTGLLFGTIEGITPIIGWGLGIAAAQVISQWDHWIAFILLAGLGARMVHAGMTQNNDPSPSTRQPLGMLILTALATSIDALVIGISLAFVDVNIGVAALAIGMTTMIMVTTGIMLGRVLGSVIGQRAETVGGLLLMALGGAILYEHLYAPLPLQALL